MIIKLNGATVANITLEGTATRVTRDQQVSISDADWASVPDGIKAMFTILRDDTLEERVDDVEEADTAQDTATAAAAAAGADADTEIDALDTAATASIAGSAIATVDAVDADTALALVNICKAKINLLITEVNALRTALASQGD